MTDPAGNTSLYDYDSATGWKIEERNALSKIRRFDYNPMGLLTSMWGDTVYPVSFTYDAEGRQTGMTTYRSGNAWTGPNWPTVVGDQTAWTYDAASGLVTAKIDAKGKSVTYNYSADGKLLTRTWARQVNGNPLTTTYTYSVAGDLLSADYSDSTSDIAYTYNRLGNFATVADAAGTRTFAYNAQFDRTGETIAGIYNKVLTYSYETSGVKWRFTGFSLDNGFSTGYSYDSYGRLNRMDRNGGGGLRLHTACQQRVD